tara:strand:- start:236307 stop:236528 length:222 start_codon:yes stop_codon:yes gene_type:complete
MKALQMEAPILNGPSVANPHMVNCEMFAVPRGLSKRIGQTLNHMISLKIFASLFAAIKGGVMILRQLLDIALL